MKYFIKDIGKIRRPKLTNGLICITIGTYYTFRWLFVVLVGLDSNPTRITNSHLKGMVSTNCCKHKLCLLMMWLDTLETCRDSGNILRKIVHQFDFSLQSKAVYATFALHVFLISTGWVDWVHSKATLLRLKLQKCGSAVHFAIPLMYGRAGRWEMHSIITPCQRLWLLWLWWWRDDVMMRFRLITYSLCQRKVKPLCRSVKGNSCIVVFVTRFSGRGLKFSERNNVTVVKLCVKILLLLNISWKITQVKIKVIQKKYSILPCLSLFEGHNWQYYSWWHREIWSSQICEHGDCVS